MLHAISLPPGDFDSALVEDLFLGCLDCGQNLRLADLSGLRVSAHCVIDRNGAVTQFVPLLQRAWHAGASCWQGQRACNDFAIGIELIGDETHPFTHAQYRHCAALCRAMMQRFSTISPDDIVGHQDIAPGRKWDPGRQWQWSRFRQLLADDADLPEVLGLR